MEADSAEADSAEADSAEADSAEAETDSAEKDSRSRLDLDRGLRWGKPPRDELNTFLPLFR